MAKSLRPSLLAGTLALSILVIAGTLFAAPVSTIIEPETGAKSGSVSVAGGDASASKGGFVQFSAVANAKKCLVWLHGKSGDANQSADSGNFTVAAPRGNAPGWGAYQWLYFPDSSYAEIITIINNAITSNACGKVIIHGFSNGAGATGALYCKGETFGGKVIGYIIDDPVADHGSDNCVHPAGVKVVIYWTGGLDGMPAGSDCAGADWTCQGGNIIGIDKYAQQVGVTYKQSINVGSHSPYPNPPELTQWW